MCRTPYTLIDSANDFQAKISSDPRLNAETTRRVASPAHPIHSNQWPCHVLTTSRTITLAPCASISEPTVLDAGKFYPTVHNARMMASAACRLGDMAGVKFLDILCQFIRTLYAARPYSSI